MRRLTYVVGMSLDGFIAGPEGQIDFFPVTDDVVAFLRDEYPETLPTQVRAHLGIDPPNRRFDIGIQGRGTYEPALELGITSPYAHLRQYVVSRTMDRGPDPAVEIISDDPVAAVRRLKTGDGLGICLLGGARLAAALLPEIDELVVKIYPVVAGDGIPLFRTGFSPTAFSLTGTRVLDGGTVVTIYRRR